LEGKLSVVEASEILGLSKRQIIRLRKGVAEKGEDAVKHGNIGRVPSTTIKSSQRQQIVVLYKSKYHGANYQHFTDLLKEHEGIGISAPTARSILNSSGVKSPKSKRKPKKHIRRKRHEHEGSLVQTDATAHDFFGTGEKSCIHGLIDDATGKVLGLHMTRNECLEGYHAVFEQMIDGYGVPASVYADRHTIFASPNSGKLTIEDELAGVRANDTQLGRAMRELGITLIKARSPQAKGRIERLWGTLQDRLTVEFRINGITEMGAANRFLQSYIPKHNRRFAVQASEPATMFAPNALDLASILCIREKRKIDSGGAFSFGGQYFVVDGDIPPGTSIEVIAHRKLGISALYKGKRHDVRRIEKPKRRKAKGPIGERKPYVPPDLHYYKYGKETYVQHSNEYTDADILAILDGLFSKSISQTVDELTGRTRRAAGFADSF